MTTRGASTRPAPGAPGGAPGRPDATVAAPTIAPPTIAAPIYLDYHATTPVDPRVADVVLGHMLGRGGAYGNASSADHVFGDVAAEAVDDAARSVGALVGAPPSAVVWTSGATEAINLVIQGMAAAAAAARGRAGPLRIAVSPTEHAAVLDTCRAVARGGAAVVHILGVDRHGRVDLDEVERACRGGLDLLCVMAANNEVGTVAPVAEIGAVARRHGVAYLCDATQACGRVPLDAAGDGVTFLALSAHKMHGPKGVGALVTTARRLLAPVLHGGEQQRGLRAGTLNVPGIAGLGAAAALRRAEMADDEPAISARRDRLQALLSDALGDGLAVNGDVGRRLAGNLHVSFLEVPNTAVIARVRERLAVATGAACASGVDAPSHVLRAMGLPPAAQEGAIRIGLGKWTTDEEVDVAAGLLAAAVADVARALRA